MSTEPQLIGSLVKKARLERKMTQQQLAEAAGLSTTFISNIENGRQSMNVHALIALSDALDVPADALIRDNPLSASRTAREIEKELTSCTPKEREVLLQLIQTMKKSISSLKGTTDK